MKKIEKVKVSSCLIDNLSLNQVVGLVKRKIKTNREGKPLLIFTINLHHLYLLEKLEKFCQAYQKADLIVPDSVFLLWLASFLGTPLRGRVNGTDLTYALLKLAQKNNFKIFFLSSWKNLGKEISAKLKGYKIKIDFFDLPFKKYEDAFLTKEAIKKINSFAPDILFVGLGVLKQEVWLAKNKEKLKVKVALGVGSALDYMSGGKKRAPLWMQKIGLEWFWRFLSEPKRLFVRYFIQDFFFGLRLIKEIIYQNLFPDG